MVAGKKQVKSKEIAELASDLKQSKYSKPKILLVDLDDESHQALEEAGYNVKSGTFGTPAIVERSGEYYYVPIETNDLPNLDEQEIVIANLKGRPAEDQELQPPGAGAHCVWQKATRGIIDPKPVIMNIIEPKINGMLNHGGLLVLLMDQVQASNYRQAEVDQYGGPESYKSRDSNLSNWSLSKHLSRLNIKEVAGNEIEFVDNELIKPFKKTVSNYTVAFGAQGFPQEEFIQLAKNKYSEPVAALYIFDGHPILMLPQIKNIHEVILELVETSCYQIRPNLFPHLTGANWLYEPKYEIPEVIKRNRAKAALLSEADARTKEIDAEIEQIRKDQSYWYTLLNGTDDELVDAVLTALDDIGFKKVIDVDKETKAGNTSDSPQALREDIRIEDTSPILVVDVKGINGNPDDDESRQSQKHCIMRINDTGNANMQPLSIINHERQKPPLLRDQKAYRKEIITYAKDTGLGLMTTWDLFLIIRNMKNLNWPEEAVKPIFYRTGRIDGAPEHYVLIGTVVDAWEPAFGIIPTSEIKVGDTLVYRTDGIFTEFVVTSLMVDKEDVTVAPAGTNCGIAFDDAKKTFKKKMKIFKIETIGTRDEI